MSNQESSEPIIPLDVQFVECANWLVNRIEGKTISELDSKDFRLLSVSTLAETEKGLALACQVGGCSVQWAINKDAKGRFTRELSIGLPVCPS